MGGVKKALLEMNGEPLLLHALRPFLSVEGVESVVVALPPSDAVDPPGWLREEDPRIRVVAGGATRGESVCAALQALDPGIAIVLVHDAARPLVTREVIERCIAGAKRGEGAIAAWPVVDTLKEVDEAGLVLSTPDRSRFRGAQTPQAFPLAGLIAGYREAEKSGLTPTDDAQAFTLGGGSVRVVEGAPWNLKVTHEEDLAVADFLLRRGRAV
jgi:2-C-methyl-D-erythritol 4-phosphate cytidylyltransferase